MGGGAGAAASSDQCGRRTAATARIQFRIGEGRRCAAAAALPNAAGGLGGRVERAAGERAIAVEAGSALDRGAAETGTAWPRVFIQRLNSLVRVVATQYLRFAVDLGQGGGLRLPPRRQEWRPEIFNSRDVPSTFS